nr:tyrosine-type recombinase/integrase [Bacillus zhangzhouensis]
MDELKQILDYIKTYKYQRCIDYQLYYMLMYFLSETGLRISEALALKWWDIEDNKVNVERQVRPDNSNKVTLTTKKSTSSYRTIGIIDAVLKELKKFKLKQNEMILSNKSFNKNSDNIIFQNYLGIYLTPSTVRESIVKKLG